MRESAGAIPSWSKLYDAPVPVRLDLLPTGAHDDAARAGRRLIWRCRRRRLES